MKIVFMGTPDFAVASLSALIEAGHEILLCVTQPDKPKGRGGKVQYSDVKQFALEHDIPVFQPVKIREEEAVSYLRGFDADIFVVAAFGQILPKEILTMPPLGCINVHASLLPKYRGAAPIQWAILNGEETTGVTIMQMGVGLDDGDILTQRETRIGEKETGGELFDRLAVLGGELLCETLPKIAAGEITPIPQDEEQATKVGMIRKDLGKLDFKKSAAELERYIRGLNPWPCAFTKLNDKTVKIYGAEVLREDGTRPSESTETGKKNDGKEGSVPEGPKIDAEAVKKAAPGDRVFADKEHLYLKTGEGLLSVRELQPEGKKRMGIKDYLNGVKL